MQLFKALSAAKKAKTVKLHAVTNEPIINDGALMDNDTGECTLPLEAQILQDLDAGSPC